MAAMRRDWRWTEMTDACREGRRSAGNDPFNAFLFRAVDAPAPDGAAAAVGPLAGVPVAVKDNIAVRGMPMTCGSLLLEGYMPPEDACVAERHKAQPAGGQDHPVSLSVLWTGGRVCQALAKPKDREERLLSSLCKRMEARRLPKAQGDMRQVQSAAASSSIRYSC